MKNNLEFQYSCREEIPLTSTRTRGIPFLNVATDANPTTHPHNKSLRTIDPTNFTHYDYWPMPMLASLETSHQASTNQVQTNHINIHQPTHDYHHGPSL